jgi:hypothetical protein
LVEVGVGLVGLPLAVAVHIDGGEGGGLDAVFAQRPHLVEDVVAGAEGGGGVVPGSVHREMFEILRADRAGKSLDLRVAEGNDLADVRRQPGHRRPGPIGNHHLRPLTARRRRGLR